MVTEKKRLMATDKERLVIIETELNYLSEYKKEAEADIEALERIVNILENDKKNLKFLFGFILSISTFLGFVLSQTLSWLHHDK